MSACYTLMSIFQKIVLHLLDIAITYAPVESFLKEQNIVLLDSISMLILECPEKACVKCSLTTCQRSWKVTWSG